MPRLAPRSAVARAPLRRYALLGGLVLRATGTRLWRHATERIAAPLGLYDITRCADPRRRHVHARAARGPAHARACATQARVAPRRVLRAPANAVGEFAPGRVGGMGRWARIVHVGR